MHTWRVKSGKRRLTARWSWRILSLCSSRMKISFRSDYCASDGAPTFLQRYIAMALLVSGDGCRSS